MKRHKLTAVYLKNKGVSVKSKFLYVGKQKFYINSVTSGTSKPDENGLQFPERDVV